MRIFKLSREYNIVCNSEGTRYGFRHLATLHKNGFQVCKAKCCYYNRTWERFEYESVMLQLIDNFFTGKQHKRMIEKIKLMG